MSRILQMQAHDHAHAHARMGTSVLAAATVATLALVATELMGGYLGHSMALLGDAVHNLSDVPTLVISWFALRWAERPADSEKTYGYHRAGILAAFTNAVLLALVALYLFYEAYERLRRPVAVREEYMIWISLAALAVNGGITLALVRGRRDLNLRSILIHNFGDALSNVAILAGALAIRMTGAVWVARAILRVPGVQEVHDIHIWTLGTDLHALSCHVRIPDMHMEDSERILAGIHERLADQFHITHTTIQFERAGLPRDAGFYMPAPLDSTK